MKASKLSLELVPGTQSLDDSSHVIMTDFKPSSVVGRVVWGRVVWGFSSLRHH